MVNTSSSSPSKPRKTQTKTKKATKTRQEAQAQAQAQAMPEQQKADADTAPSLSDVLRTLKEEEAKESTCKLPGMFKRSPTAVWTDGNQYHRDSFRLNNVRWPWPSDGNLSWDAQERESLITGLSTQVRDIVKELEALYGDEVSLLGVGISGSLLVPSIADKLQMPFALIRAKDSVSSSGRPHDDYTSRLVGYTARSVLFIDDLIDSGSTLRDANDLLLPYGRRIRGAALLRPYYGHPYYGRPEGMPFGSTANAMLDEVLIWDGLRVKAQPL